MSRYLSTPPDPGELADDLDGIAQIVTALGYYYEREPGTAMMKTTDVINKYIRHIADQLRQADNE